MKTTLFLLLCCACGSALADPNLTFHGFLVEPPNCTVSEGKDIDIEFHDVLVDDINGSNYAQTVPYTITCDSSIRDASMVMSLSWTGSQTDFDDTAVTTDITGLGIRLLQNGVPFELNTPLTIDEQSLPTLQAVPVKKAGVELVESTFEGRATLQVDYQ